jgi:hypothetical protein
MVVVSVLFEGISESPLMAINMLDEGLMESLTTTGRFEEFDVARRSLGTGPAYGRPAGSRSSLAAPQTRRIHAPLFTRLNLS